MRSKNSQGPLTIVFDVGGVLAAGPDASGAIAHVLGCAPAVISELFWDGRAAYDLGTPPEEYFAPLAAAAGVELDAPYTPAPAAAQPEQDAEDAELAEVLAQIDAAEPDDEDDDVEPAAAPAIELERSAAAPAGKDGETYLDALIAADNAYWSEIHPATRELIHELARQRLRLAVLSNAPFVFADRLRQVDWAEAFDIVIVSGEEGVAKPDPEIYEILFEEVKNYTGGVAVPGNIVFFDDRAENVDAARRLGIDAHHWPTNGRVPDGTAPGWETARTALAARGVTFD